MLHVVPIICLIVFVWFLEIRLKKELQDLENKINK